MKGDGRRSVCWTVAKNLAGYHPRLEPSGLAGSDRHLASTCRSSGQHPNRAAEHQLRTELQARIIDQAKAVGLHV